MTSHNLSIHPRSSVFGNGSKKNTCAPRSKKKWERAAAGMRKHLMDHPRDAACLSRLKTAEANAA
jgi:hypothetical protein